MRAFQKATQAVLEEHGAALLVAPTGMGKTRAALGPFLHHLGGGAVPQLGTRLLYVLPLRALAGGVLRELEDGLPEGVPVAVHHGSRPESYLFSEPATITTVDQYLTAFAGAPLSFGAQHGHALAGAVLASYSVFDEAHLLSPQQGLPLLLAVLQQRRRWGLPSLVMTATLPQTVRKVLAEEAGLPEVPVDPREVWDLRDGSRRVTLEVAAEPLKLDEVVAQVAAEGRQRRVILFANTVSRALAYYDRLCQHPDLKDRVMLAHSRFTPRHRQDLDDRITRRFGRSPAWDRGVLVTTQVAEAGLNISAPVVFTEAAPADSLVQRAGRCARFVPEGGTIAGEMRVFRLQEAAAAPYAEVLVERTLDALQGLKGEALTWEAEQRLVDEALARPYQCYLRGQPFDPKQEGECTSRRLTTARALGLYEQAYRSRSPDAVERELRDAMPAALIIRPRTELQHPGSGEPGAPNAPLAAEVEANLRLPRFRRRQLESLSISVGLLYQMGKNPDLQGALYELRVDKQKQVSLLPARTFRPGGTYVLAAEVAGYSETAGLTLDKKWGSGVTGWLEPQGGGDRRGGREQDFVTHARGVHARVRRLGELYRPFLEAWQERVFGHEGPQDPAESVAAILDFIGLAALFHDVGKLNRYWQEAAGHSGPGYIARTAQQDRAVPPHAYYAYPLIQSLLQPYSSDAPVDAFVALATARHHTIGRDGDTVAWGRDRPAEFAPDVLPLLRSLLQELPAANPQAEATPNGELDALAATLDESLLARLRQGQETVDAPSPADDFYLLYCLANRMVKLADHEDAAGAAIELRGLAAAEATGAEGREEA